MKRSSQEWPARRVIYSRRTTYRGSYEIQPRRAARRSEHGSDTAHDRRRAGARHTRRARRGRAARDTLAGTKPAWATPKADKGSTADSAQVSARVYLAGRDAAGLAAYAKAVSDPASPAYGKYLSAQQADARFGATKAQVAAVKSWLTAAGLKVTGTTRHYVSVSGDVAAVEKAFGTQLHNYAKGSRTYRAPSKAASAPAGLDGAVLTVTGLDNAPHKAASKDQLPPPDAVFKNSGPFSTYYGSNTASTLPSAYGKEIPYAVQGYTGKQLRAAYGAAGTPASMSASPSPTRTPRRRSPSTRPPTRRRTATSSGRRAS